MKTAIIYKLDTSTLADRPFEDSCIIPRVGEIVVLHATLSSGWRNYVVIRVTHHVDMVRDEHDITINLREE